MNTFERFENDLLFSYFEVPIIVSMDNEEIHVAIDETDITDTFTPNELADLEDNFNIAAGESRSEDALVKADMEYDAWKDSLLGEVA